MNPLEAATPSEWASSLNRPPSRLTARGLARGRHTTNKNGRPE